MLSRRSQTESFVLAAFHSFNYSLLGKVGFSAMSTLMDSVKCYDLTYHELDWAIETLDKLHHGVIG